jgi:hypothetical protein
VEEGKKEFGGPAGRKSETIRQKPLDPKKNQLQLKSRSKTRRKTLTAGSAWTPLNGSTQGWKKAVLSVRLRALNRWAMAHRVALGLNGTLGDPVA